MKGNKSLISNKCPMCGKDSGFTPTEGRLKQSRARKFCSKKCSTSFRHKDKVLLSICPLCKKQFKKWKDGKNDVKYCSAKCFDEMRHKNLPKYNYPIKEKKNYKQKKINGKQIFYHRWVMENHLGRKLLRTEVIHHINGDRHDNRIENLQLMTQSEHMKLESFQWKNNSH